MLAKYSERVIVKVIEINYDRWKYGELFLKFAISFTKVLALIGKDC